MKIVPIKKIDRKSGVRHQSPAGSLAGPAQPEGCSCFTGCHDANGNILGQLRSDSEGKEIDSLTYRYSVGQYGLTRNRLYHVNDTVRTIGTVSNQFDMAVFETPITCEWKAEC